MTRPDALPDEADDQMLQGARVAAVEIKLLQETLNEMHAILAHNGWEPEKGLRILLCQGLGYAKGRLALQSTDQERATLAQRLARTESLYAVMKYDVFHMTRDNQTLAMRDAALTNSDQLHRQTILRQRAELEQAQERIRQLTSQVERFRLEANPGRLPAQRTPWYRRWLSRRRSAGPS